METIANIIKHNLYICKHNLKSKYAFWEEILDNGADTVRVFMEVSKSLLYLHDVFDHNYRTVLLFVLKLHITL